MVLTNQAKSRIRNLSRENVELTLANMSRFFKKSRWVGSTNRYATNTIRKISLDARAGQIGNPRNLAQYISASSVLHCTDGWSYLGKSVFALLRGDVRCSLHLAYYAELRAAMSLLAAEGIGIFNRRHFYIDSANSAKLLHNRCGTHLFAWNALEYWSTLGASGYLFAQTIKPGGRTLEDWLSPVGGIGAAAPQARQWFQQWGMDLRLFSRDHIARNESSYRPDGIPISSFIETSEVVKFASDIWLSLEPSSVSKFETIDRQILRLTLENRFIGTTGKKPNDAPGQFQAYIESVVGQQGFAERIDADWKRFIGREDGHQDLSIFEFSQFPPDKSSKDCLAVISRSVLLLRVASGATSALLKRSGYDANSISFWWMNLGQSRGFWNTAPDADNLADLWADVDTALDDVSNFQSEYAQPGMSFFDVCSQLKHTLVDLSGHERVAIWSIPSS